MLEEYDKICGMKLKRLRIAKNLSLSEVGEMLNMGKSAICLYENGKRRVDVVTLSKLMAIYTYPLGKFVDECIAEVNE